MSLLVEALKPYLKELVNDAVSELSEQVKPRSPAPFSVEQAAEYLGIPVGTLYQLTHQKAIPFHKVGRRLRFFQDELDSWMKKKGEKS